jgi:hypothetical protein
LMRDGKFSEISELANLATLEALQFTKWDKSDKSTSITDLEPGTWGVYTRFVAQPWCGLYVTSVERASSPPKDSYWSAGAMHLQEAENAPKFVCCEQGSDQRMLWCQEANHTFWCRGITTTRKRTEANERELLVCLCFDWPGRCNADHILSKKKNADHMRVVVVHLWRRYT